MTTSNNKQQSIITEKENSLVELTAKVEALEKENEQFAKNLKEELRDLQLKDQILKLKSFGLLIRYIFSVYQ